MSFSSKNDILAAVRTLLLTLTVPASSDPLFTSDGVKVFSQANLQAAFEELLVFEERACFLVTTGEEFVNQRSGNVVTSKKTVSLSLLICDQNYGERMAAFTGDSETVGVSPMSEIIVAALFGKTLTSLPFAVVLPLSGDSFYLSNVQRSNEERAELAGRECWSQEFEIYAGSDKREIGRNA